jgi:hypothetical protein
MPYAIKGTTVYKRNGKKLTKKAKAKSRASASRMVRLLNAIEFGGFMPNGRKKKKKNSKKKIT